MPWERAGKEHNGKVQDFISAPGRRRGRGVRLGRSPPKILNDKFTVVDYYES